jgi:hypothetical protein
MRRMVLGLAVVLASAFGVVGSYAQQPGGVPQRALPPNLPVTPPAGSLGIVPHGDAIPAFTVDDAKAWVSTHSLPFGLGRNVKPMVTRAEFLTSQQVSALLHGVTTGFAPDHLLCYVELQGPVSFAGPQGATTTYNRGVLIFDARTGNLVIGGGMP